MSQKPVIVFFGTPEFAVPSLEILHKEGYPVAAVVTAPDKPAGRGQKIAQSPVKEFASANGLSIIQPSNLKSEEFLDQLKKLNADIFVIVAFRMLPEAVWQMPPKGSFNLHASLLPQYRGSAPINWAIINGEKETGLTTFFLEKEIDTGKIIFQERTIIGNMETAGELHDRLMTQGAAMVLRTVQAIVDGTVHTIDQRELEPKALQAAPKLNKANTRIDKSRTPEEVVNFILGLNPYPGAWTHLNNANGISFAIKIFNATPHKATHSFPAGHIDSDNKSFLNIYLRTGYISVKELQLAGRKRVAITDFLNGLKIEGNWFID